MKKKDLHQDKSEKFRNEQTFHNIKGTFDKRQNC